MSGAWAKGATKAVAAPPSNPTLAPNRGAGTGGGGGAGSGGGQGRGRGGGGGGGGGRNNQNRNSGGGGGGGGRNRNKGGNNNNNRDNSGGGGGGRGRGGGGGGGSGGGGGGGGGGGKRHGNNRNGSNHNNNQNSGGGKVERVIIKDARLLEETGLGDTPARQAVIRISARHFMNVRLQYLEAPADFVPHSQCHWTDKTRVEELQALSSKVMELGDVSKKNARENSNAANSSLPSLEECKPLEVNEETRWKGKKLKETKGEARKDGEDVGNDQQQSREEQVEEVMAKALAILNKVSWTTLEKLTGVFLEETKLEEEEDVRKACIELIVDKSHTEPHFGPMYAQICATIALKVKPFKKELLTQCQSHFEVDLAHKIANAKKETEDPEEQAYKENLIRKAYIGHMQFLGELYKRDVLKLSIMMYCLDELLKDENDDGTDKSSPSKTTTNEQSLECFAHLMTTIGEKLEDHAKQNNKPPFDWSKVTAMVDKSNKDISNRIKFMLKDLLELKERGWVTRRKVEKAKTIAEIHKELAMEEKAKAVATRRASTSSVSLRRSSSVASVPTNLASSTSMSNIVQADEDGFVQIKRGSMKKVTSKGQAMNQMDSNSNNVPGVPKKAPILRRSVSQPAAMGGVEPSPFTAKRIKENFGKAPGLPMPMTAEAPASPKVLSPNECSEKAKNIFKEYFIGGDTDDAVLSIQELVSVDHPDGEATVRAAKIIEGVTLMVMEMKEAEVKKVLTVLRRCCCDTSEGDDADGSQEKKDKIVITREGIAMGLNDPLEFLSDIEIDAPLAGDHLATMLAAYVDWGLLTLDMLTLPQVPEYFKTDGKPAAFAIKIVKRRKGGEEATPEELQVIETLMTSGDKEKFSSAKDMITAAPALMA